MWHGTSSTSSDVGAAEEAEALLSRGRGKQAGEEPTKSNDAAAYKVTLHGAYLRDCGRNPDLVTTWYP
jgi:hypothetical protein